MSPRAFLLIAAASFCVPALHAATPLSGNVFDGAGGPLLAGQVYTTAGFTVPAGQTLTVQAGVIVKSTGGGIDVGGTLLVNGTAGMPAIFTSIHDDAAGGDTNGNGAGTSPGPDQWVGLVFGAASDASQVDHAIVRYTGQGFSPAVHLGGSDATFTNCTFSDGQWGGMRLAAGALPTVSQCTFSALGNNPAVFGATWSSIPGFSGNVSTGTPGGAGLQLDDGTVSGSVSVAKTAMLGGAIVLNAGVTVPAGTQLHLSQGVVLKMKASAGIVVDGTLLTDGTSVEPVVFTTFPDDVYGGDTNANGPSNGAPDTWFGLQFNAGAGASTLRHAIVRYGGQGFTANVEVFDAGITLEDSTLEKGQHGGLDLNGTTAKPTVTGCSFTGNLEQAVRGVSVDGLAGFAGNAATGNGTNALWVSVGTPVADATIPAAAQLNGAIVWATSFSIPASRKVSIGPGVVIKFQAASGITIDGALDVLGTPSEPVVITTFADDEYAGDTNNDGPSSGAPDTWTGIQFGPSAAASLVENLRVRYAGQGFTPNLRCNSPNVTLRNVRAERGAHGGFDINAHAGIARNWVAYSNNDYGIRLGGGSFALVRATAANGNGAGIQNTGGFLGTVTSSVAWGNAASFSGFAPGKVTYSAGNGLSGGTGNTGLDPMFENAAAGDLRLKAGSPAIDAGDPVDLFGGLDPRGNPRRVDGDLNGFPVVDQGAYEFDNVELAITGQAAPLSQLTFTTTGTNAFTSAFLIFGMPGPELYVDPFGPLFIDLLGPWLTFAWPAQPVQIPLVVPQGFPSVTLTLQIAGLEQGGATGNLSNPVTLTFP